MKKSSECPPPSRGSGRTTWMVRQACDFIDEGGPKCLVVGHSEYFTKMILSRMVLEELRDRGLWIRKILGKSLTYDVHGTVLKFCTISAMDDTLRGRTGWSTFIDHVAAGEL